jgi:hypothetical protein
MFAYLFQFHRLVRLISLILYTMICGHHQSSVSQVINIIWLFLMTLDLKDWCITKELALDRREWKLAIPVPEP